MNYRLFPVVVKKLSIADHVYHIAMKIAESSGMNFQEYIKYLITADIRKYQTDSKFKLSHEDATLIINLISEIEQGKMYKTKELRLKINKLKRYLDFD